MKPLSGKWLYCLTKLHQSIFGHLAYIPPFPALFEELFYNEKVRELSAETAKFWYTSDEYSVNLLPSIFLGAAGMLGEAKVEQIGSFHAAKYDDIWRLDDFHQSAIVPCSGVNTSVPK